MSIAALGTRPLPLAPPPGDGGSGDPGGPTGGGGGVDGGGPKPPCDHNGPHGPAPHKETGAHKRAKRERREAQAEQREANQCAIRGGEYINGRCVPQAKVGAGS